jgi:hypothetical protein
MHGAERLTAEPASRSCSSLTDRPILRFKMCRLAPERLVGTIRREWLDFLIPFGENRLGVCVRLQREDLVDPDNIDDAVKAEPATCSS